MHTLVRPSIYGCRVNQSTRLDEVAPVFSLLCSGFQAWSNAFYWARHADIQMMFRWIDIAYTVFLIRCCCDPRFSSLGVWVDLYSLRSNIRVPVPASQGRCRGNRAMASCNSSTALGRHMLRRVESHQYSTIPWAYRSISILICPCPKLSRWWACDGQKQIDVLTSARIRG